VLEAREAPSASPWLVESFDSTPLKQLPAGWQQWGSSSAASAGVWSGLAFSSPNSLALSATASNGATRAWLNAPLPPDVQVSAAVYLNSLVPVQILARASGLNSTTPSYYALSLNRGMQTQLLRVVNGVSTSLGQITSLRYLSNQWVQATLSVVGTSIQGQIYRTDTGQYLTATGQWQAAQAWAFSVSDTALTGVGLAGVARTASYTGTVSLDDFTVALPGSSQSFDTTAVGALPSGWQHWTSTGTGGFGASAALSLSSPNSLAVTASSSTFSARAWDATLQPADVQVDAAVFLSSIIPAQVLARGTALNTASPTYYALSIVRGPQVDLVKVVNGVATTLGQVTSSAYFNNLWVDVALSVNATTLQARVFRPDTAQYLSASGTWQSSPAWALSVTDVSIAGVGLAGVGRPASYTGTTAFDNFLVMPGIGDINPPSVTISVPTPASTLSGVVQVQAGATDNVGVTKVEFYLDNVLRATAITAPFQWSFDTSIASNASHALTVKAYDLAGNVGAASETIVTQNASALPKPIIPQHYPNIRIAELAYSGTPLGSFETGLLQNSVDLVIPDTRYLSQISAIAPNTPQLIYSNASSIAQGMLISWDNYADAQGISRESAFYHAARPIPFTGASPSSQPVDWFWGVYTEQGSSFTNLTSAAHSGSQAIPLGQQGASLSIGYPEEFNEINFTIFQGAQFGWTAVLEYPTAVDASGNPTAWAPLATTADSTSGLARSGQMTFDPPANWQPASIAGSARLFYVRLRTTASGTAPVATSVLGADYVNANGASSGVIPVFDYAADVDHDGYLNDAEYAQALAIGDTARFAYQSRAFFDHDGQMRFATNPATAAFRAWLVGFDAALLNSFPLASGLFVDNSTGDAPVNAADVLESVGSYSADYASMLSSVGQAIAPKWLLANTANSAGGASAVIQKVQGYFQEFALAPLASTSSQFEALAAQTAQWAALTAPAPYAILDSVATGGSPTDPRTELATLAEYYLVADPATTFLDPFGGSAPATSWSQHWIPAAAYNIGTPTGVWSLLVSGADPSNTALTYHVYARPYSNALVLYKPLSQGNRTGTLADNTATTIALGGTYEPLQADGTLGAPITSVSLRNGEGAILVKV
jgi:hypothetical protein